MSIDELIASLRRSGDYEAADVLELARAALVHLLRVHEYRDQDTAEAIADQMMSART
jgi:hypothetical protein